MNAKTEAAVMEHGKRLLVIFPNATERDPVKLCRKLRKLEREGAAFGLRLCNGPEYKTEGAQEAVAEEILNRLDALLGYMAAGVPVFLNRDPRGYALKIESKWMEARRDVVKLCRDWGGYGIIAPDLSEK